jgi:glycosyltransferase involved in cell wall biosynthesis
LIFSPANLAPWIWPRNVIVLHDAAVFRVWESYSRAYRAWHARFEPALARRALKVITVSEFCRRELVELGGLDPSDVAVVHGGVNDRFRPDADRERVAREHRLERPYVLTVATDDRRKNLNVLAAASRRLRELGLELVWAGASTAHIRHGATVDGVRPLGYVDERDLPGLYAGARAFVLPSHYEGFGLPCVEAMACGTPVVAAERGALPEACGGAAILVDPDDPVAVADAVASAATEDRLRTRLREAGLERTAGLTWERTAAEIDALLTGLVS